VAATNQQNTPRQNTWTHCQEQSHNHNQQPCQHTRKNTMLSHQHQLHITVQHNDSKSYHHTLSLEIFLVFCHKICRHEF
jgi:hypothetical protein